VRVACLVFDRRNLDDLLGGKLEKNLSNGLHVAKERKDEVPIQVHLATSRDVAILRSKEWFRMDDAEIGIRQTQLG
jgi:hypothetical protein